MISLPHLLHSVILPIEREKRENCGEREKWREGETWGRENSRELLYLAGIRISCWLGVIPCRRGWSTSEFFFFHEVDSVPTLSSLSKWKNLTLAEIKRSLKAELMDEIFLGVSPNVVEYLRFSKKVSRYLFAIQFNFVCYGVLCTCHNVRFIIVTCHL